MVISPFFDLDLFYQTRPSLSTVVKNYKYRVKYYNLHIFCAGCVIVRVSTGNREPRKKEERRKQDGTHHHRRHRRCRVRRCRAHRYEITTRLQRYTKTTERRNRHDAHRCHFHPGRCCRYGRRDRLPLIAQQKQRDASWRPFCFFMQNRSPARQSRRRDRIRSTRC